MAVKQIYDIVYFVHHNVCPREHKDNPYCHIFDDEMPIGEMDIEVLLEYGKHKMEADGGYVEGMPMFVWDKERMEFRTAIM